jgi:prepilin-type N-terminal cleavage/methylation domain-containing protein
MTSPRSRAGGFSLVEIMIAMTIIVIALFGVLSMTIHTSTTKESLREMEVAKQAASRKIDEIRGLPWDNAVPSVIVTYAGGTYQPETVDGLSFHGTDTWNTTLNPQKKGKLSVIIHGTNAVVVGGVAQTKLIDFEVLVDWIGVRGRSRYSTRMMLTQDQKKNS